MEDSLKQYRKAKADLLMNLKEWAENVTLRLKQYNL